MMFMSSRKKRGEKIKLVASKTKRAPFWASVKKFTLKRASTRRILSAVKHWRRGRIKV